jgi:Glycosyltransferase family 87
LSRRTVIVSVVALNVIVLLAPPMFSTDAFSYQAYAREFAIYHTNPYTHGPGSIEGDLIYNYIGSKWIHTPSVYGPLFTLISAPLAWTSIVVSELTFKIVAALCSAGTLLLIWKTARLRDVDPIRGIALYGLNPMVMIYGVGGGHNDFLMVSLMMWGVYATLLKRDLRGGMLLVTGTAIKLTGGILLPFALLANRGSANAAVPRRFLTGAFLVVAAVATASFAFFGNGVIHMLSTLQTVQDKGAWQSVPGFLLSVSHLGVTSLMRTLMSVILVGSVAWLLWRVWQRKLDWLEGATWATVVVLVTAWALLPWYIVWLMPLVAVSKNRRLWDVAIVLSLMSGAMMVADCTPTGIPGLSL